jgi:hypothetical protein
VDAALHQEATNVFELLSRVQQLFGGDAPPVDPPAVSRPDWKPPSAVPGSRARG